MSRTYWAMLRMTLLVGSYSILVKVFSVAKEGLVAYRVGVSPELDAFLVAFAFPNFLFGALNSALATAFVPAFMKARINSGDVAARGMAAQLSWILALCLVVGAAVCTPLLVGLIPVIAHQFSPDTVRLAASMLYILVPALVLNGISGACSGYLNANERFAIAAMVPAVTPMIAAVALMVGWNALGIHALAFGTLAGAFVELLIVGSAAMRLGLPVSCVSGYWSMIRRDIGPQFVAASTGTLMVGATILVDQAMAAMLAPGSVSALSFGSRVPSVLVGLGTAALATVLLPHLSRLVANSDSSEVLKLLKQSSVLTLSISIPTTVALVLFAKPIITLLFQRGAFDAGDTTIVTHVQMAYALHIPFYAWSVVPARLLSAMQENSVILVIASGALILNVVLNLALSRYFGVVGIALATSGMYLASCILLWVAAKARLRRFTAEVSAKR